MYLNGLLKTTPQYLMSDERTEVSVWRERRDILLLSALVLGATAGTRDLLPLATLPEARLERERERRTERSRRTPFSRPSNLRARYARAIKNDKERARPTYTADEHRLYNLDSRCASHRSFIRSSMGTLRRTRLFCEEDPWMNYLPVCSILSTISMY